MHTNEPEMAKNWEKEKKAKKESKVRSLIKKMVREIMSEEWDSSKDEKMVAIYTDQLKNAKNQKDFDK